MLDYTVFNSGKHLPLFNTGEVISDRDKCPQCKGNKVTQEKKVLEVHVEKGMQHGQKITFDGQADEAVSEITFGIDWRHGFDHILFSSPGYRLQRGSFYGIGWCISCETTVVHF